MKNLMIAILISAQVWTMWNYGIAVGYIETMQPEVIEKVVQVAVNEVDIPLVYNAKELNEYCEYEYTALQNMEV